MLNLFRKASPRKLVRAAIAVAILAYTSPALASGGSSMPYIGPMQTIVDSITGPFAKLAGIVAIVLAGLGFAFSEGGGLMKKVMGIVVGLSCAFAASTWGLQLFGFSSGAGF